MSSDTSYDDFEFLAVIGIPKSKRVLCQAVGCGHSVYKRVHVFRLGGNISIYGSECAKKILGAQENEHTPRYTSATGINLSELDAQMLKDNTGKLLEKLRIKYSESLAANQLQESILNSNVQDAENKVAERNNDNHQKLSTEELHNHHIELLKDLALRGDPRARKDLEFFLAQKKDKKEN